MEMTHQRSRERDANVFEMERPIKLRFQMSQEKYPKMESNSFQIVPHSFP